MIFNISVKGKSMGDTQKPCERAYRDENGLFWLIDFETLEDFVAFCEKRLVLVGGRGTWVQIMEEFPDLED